MPEASEERDILLRRQKVLADFGDFALQSGDLGEVLTEACQLVADALGLKRARVLQIEEGGESLMVRAGVGWDPRVVGEVRVSMDERSSESYAIQAGEPIISRDIRDEDRFEVPEFMKEEGVVALANVPIFLPGRRAYGLLQVDDTEPRNFDQNDVEFLRTYAAILGPVIDRLLKVYDLSQSEQRFRLTVEATTDYAIFVTDTEDRITDWLPGAAAVFGWSAEEVVGQHGSILFTPEDRQAGEPEKEVETARAKGSAPNVRQHLRKDGSRVFIDGVVRALFDAQGNHQGFLKIGQDVSDRHEADRRLRENEERFRSLATLVPALLWQTDATGEEVTLAPSWLDYTGQSVEEGQRGGWLDAVHPDDRSTTERLFANAYRTGEPLELQRRVRRKDGEYRWFLIRHIPWHDEQGRIVRWYGAATDIHELHELQERQAVMVAELQHRTRNLIGVIRSIANQTMARTGPAEAFREQFDRRLAALSRVQGLLSRAEQEPITIGVLLKLELEAMGVGKNRRVTLDGPAVRLRSRLVQTLALAIHELATNARKYGALSEENGRLSVAWQLQETEGERRLFVDWREEGLSHHEERTSSDHGDGYGRGLIERALPYALAAETTYDLTSDRLRCTIALPLSRPTQATGD